MKFSVHTADELISVIPHLLGFNPQESLVLVPLSPQLPVARLDLPTSAREREHAWESVSDVYTRHAQPGATVGLVAFAADRDHADRLGQDFTLRLGAIGIAAPMRLWAGDTQWADLDTGVAGPLTPATREIVAALTVLNGLAQPAPSRESLAASLVGDREPVAALLSDARAAAAASTTDAEAAFALDQLGTFHSDGIRLKDPEAARLLVAVESIPIRDQLWHDMTTENATSHVALWSDMTRRAPDSVRAAPATMLAFASWLKGNGALAWCALDHSPEPALSSSGPRDRRRAERCAPRHMGSHQDRRHHRRPHPRPRRAGPLGEDTAHSAPTGDLRHLMHSTYRRHHPPRSQIERLLTRLAVRQRDHLTAPWQVDVIPDVPVSLDPGDN